MNGATRLLITAVLITSSLYSEAGSCDEIKIGLRAIRGSYAALARWQPTADYLSEKIPEYTFVFVPYENNSALNQAVSRNEFDFVLTNPASHVEQQIFYGVSPIATLINHRNGKGSTRFGSIIFTRADRDDINSLKDLKGKIFMAADEQGFGGWRISWYELLQHGLDPYRDFKQLSFAGGIQPNVVLAVGDGQADAGTVRTDMLERMARNGIIRLEDFKILGARQTSGFEFPHSTDLYPEWPFAKLANTPDELARKVAAALFNMPVDSDAAVNGRYTGWTVPLDYTPVSKLLEKLHVGPYETTSPPGWKETLDAYWRYVVFSIFIVVASVVIASMFARSNRRLKLARLNLESEMEHRNEIEEELKKSRRMLQQVLDTIPARVFWKDRNSIYLGCNKLFALDAGLESPKDLIGKSDHDMGWKQQADLYRADDHKVMQLSRPKLNYEEPQTTPDGKRIWLETSKIPLTDPEGDVIGILGTYQDITERKKNQEELERYKQHLEEMVKERTAALEASNRELESYSYSIAHDLRSPLRALVSFSQIIAEDAAPRLNEQELEALGRIVSAGKHMAELIDDILELSRITRRELTYQNVNLSVISRDIARNLTALNSSRKINWNIQEDMKGNGDEQLLRLLMQNLIDNAWKFTRNKDSATIDIGCKQSNSESIYYVSDNGVGFNMEYADSIFRPFQRLNVDEFEGTGIGLATVQRIVQRHGGRVWVEANPQQGATFYFTLLSRQPAMLQ